MTSKKLIFATTSLYNIPPAIVDVKDYYKLRHFKWNVTKKKGATNYYYHTRIDSKWVRMHRLILGVTDPKIFVDHINHITNDNRRKNLRISNNQLNAMNRKKCLGALPYKGIKISRYGYEAGIRINGKTKYLGYSKKIEDAALMYNNAASELFGEYACLNDI